MLLTYKGGDNFSQISAMRAMFEARKLIFIDQLGWDLPIFDGRYEIDQFDDKHAEYLIVVDADGRHRASTRLLKTDRPYLLGSLYPHLTQAIIPQGPRVREITRFCLDPNLAKGERLVARNELVSGIADYALANGLTDYTGVAEMPWLRKILSFGWDCAVLERPNTQAERGSEELAALHIQIDGATITRLRETGIYCSPTLIQSRDLETAA